MVTTTVLSCSSLLALPIAIVIVYTINAITMLCVISYYDEYEYHRSKLKFLCDFFIPLGYFIRRIIVLAIKK